MEIGIRIGIGLNGLGCGAHTASGMLSIVPNGGGVPGSRDVMEKQNRAVTTAEFQANILDGAKPALTWAGWHMIAG